MSHKHHNCNCDHESVKYCKCCRTVYCENCTQEWKTPQSYWTYSGIYNGTTTNKAVIRDDWQSAIQNIPDNVTLCKHEAK